MAKLGTAGSFVRESVIRSALSARAEFAGQYSRKPLIAASRGYDKYLRKQRISELEASGEIDMDVWFELRDEVCGDTIKKVAMTRLAAHILNKRLKIIGFRLARIPTGSVPLDRVIRMLEHGNQFS